MKRSTIAAGLIALVVLLLLGAGVRSYNHLVALDQRVSSQWAQVENTYQRRADLVPNLVATVAGAAAHERETLMAVTDARARVGQLPPGPLYEDAAALQRYQDAQQQLSGALTRLLAVSEAYPQLRASENFLALQAQLEGTENRITVERMRFNEAARDFNTTRSSFPTVMIAGLFGDEFDAKAYFQAQAGAAQAPPVEFQ
jgi:LemA protein